MSGSPLNIRSHGTDYDDNSGDSVYSRTPDTTTSQFGADIIPPVVVLATAGYDHTIRFWDVVSGVCTSTLQYNLSQVNSLAISNDKRLLAAAGNPQVHLFDTTSATGPLRVLESPAGNVTALGFEADGRWLFTTDDCGSLKVWDLRAAKCQRDLDNKAAINSAALHPNQGDILTADQNGSLRVWDLTSNTCTTEMIPEEQIPLRSVSVTLDGDKIAVANNKGRVFVWKGHQPSGEFIPITKVQAHQDYITRCVFSPSTDLLATTSSDHTVKIWQFGSTSSPTGRERARSDDDYDDENPSFGHDDGDFIAFTSDEEELAGDAESPLLLRETLEGHLKWAWDCTWSADSAYLVSASSDGTARLWSVSSGDCICIYTGHTKALTSVALNDFAIP